MYVLPFIAFLILYIALTWLLNKKAKTLVAGNYESYAKFTLMYVCPWLCVGIVSTVLSFSVGSEISRLNSDISMFWWLPPIIGLGAAASMLQKLIGLIEKLTNGKDSQ